MRFCILTPSLPFTYFHSLRASYIGKVNGIDVSKDVMIDNTNPKIDVIHVMIPKNTLIQLAEQLNRT